MTGLLTIEVDYVRHQDADPGDIAHETLYALYPEMALPSRVKERLDLFVHTLWESGLPMDREVVAMDVYKMTLLISATLNHDSNVGVTVGTFVGLGIIDRRNLGEDNGLYTFYAADSIISTVPPFTEFEKSFFRFQSKIASITHSLLSDDEKPLSEIGRSISTAYGNRLLMGSLVGVMIPHMSEFITVTENRQLDWAEAQSATQKLIHDMQDITGLTLFS